MNKRHRQPMGKAGAPVFADVGDQPLAPQPSPRRHRSDQGRRQVRLWMLVLLHLVVVMIVVGGLTRITDSGLSITEWQPVRGILPPLDGVAWAAEFAKYRQIPEFRLKYPTMTLAEFKVIYWWEWGHRQLGRLIGLAWAIGFLWLALRRAFPPGWTMRALIIGALGGLQGAIGWWMVASGLVGDAVDVAPLRLSIHLTMAFAILMILEWHVLLAGRSAADLLAARRNREQRLARLATVATALTLAQIALGALVSGSGAGHAFPTWPSMNGEFLPSNSFDMVPLTINFFDNVSLTQFNHRLSAYLLMIVVAWLWLRSRRSSHDAVRRGFSLFALAVLGQAILGIVTAVHAAPPALAILHQAGGIAVIAIAVLVTFHCHYPMQSRRAQRQDRRLR